jgi:DNA polymerase III delta prime subunit
MIESITMTYIIVGNNEENIKGEIRKLLNTLWGKDIPEDILATQNPDLHILESTNIKSIGIEDVKNLQKDMIFSPYEELTQVAIIFDAEKLTVQAQNSFLKTLEESSPTSTYIFTISNEKNLLPTVLSRALKIYTKNEKEIVSGGGGEEILQMNMVDAFNHIEKIAKDREKTLELIKDLELFFQKKLEKNIKNRDNIQGIYLQISNIIKARQRVEANGNRRLLLENLFLDLTRNLDS